MSHLEHLLRKKSEWGVFLCKFGEGATLGNSQELLLLALCSGMTPSGGWWTM